MLTRSLDGPPSVRRAPRRLPRGRLRSRVTPFCGLAVLEELAGFRTEVEDPFAARLREFPGQALESHQREVVDRAGRLAARLDPRRVEDG